MKITVTVDRPLGTTHPNHKDLIYPINYGYVKGIIANDGEEQDAYILGIFEPVKEFTGKLVAVIKRLDDNEDKWVVAPENTAFTPEEIKKAVNFQEQYFKTEIKPVNKISWLFFDIGSTLIDESECIKKRCEVIINSNSINRDEFYNKVKECAETDSYAVKAAAKFYGVEIPRWFGELEKLYPDVQKVLEHLSQNYKLGIIANQTLGTKERLDNWGIGKYFDVVVASAETGFAKPDLKIFNIALEQAKCHPNEAVMIGDRIDNDIVPARKLGMKTIWIRQGFSKLYQKKQEDEFDISVDSLDELLRALIHLEIQ